METFKLSQQRKHKSNINKICRKSNINKIYAMNISAKFQLHPLMASEEMIFENLFTKLAFWLPWQPIKFRNLDKIHMVGRGLLKEQFCKTFVKISAVRQK